MAVGDGLILMTPSSISHTGTSATINSAGGVDFVAVSVLSLDGVFTSSYTNYQILISHFSNINNAYHYFRLRASGSDASGTNYTNQRFNASGAAVISIERNTSQMHGYFSRMADPGYTGGELYVYGPALAQSTAFRSITAPGISGAAIEDDVGSHSLTTAYDGITFTTTDAARLITGSVYVYGYEE